ncbi:hypothetical protein [Adoxophyes orana nucleopolyhedrovirus]|uniref:hypothetical protein n=1 Tax=Adoxophyes orana nucleopolyhedrovirus TaxID=542343 RepID=UPI0001829BD5|nr:hypothetical protein [Adoxophyes orana nucleopolyhedrovirus]ACF05296.1 hypothetical protein [Adoxophyes orana nucleopolyhedrovirus]
MLASNYLLNEPINDLQDFFKLLKPNELQNKILNNNYNLNLQEAVQLLQLANEIVDGLKISQPQYKIPAPVSMPVSQLDKLPILKNIVNKVDIEEYKKQMTEILNNISLKQNVEDNYKQFFIIYKQYLQDQKQRENIDKLFNKIVDLDNAIPVTRCPYPQEIGNVKRPDANQESFYSLENFFVDEDKTVAELQSNIINPIDLYQTATEVFSIPFGGVPPPPPPPPPADIMPPPPPPPPPPLKNIQQGVKKPVKSSPAPSSSPPFAINKHLELIQKGVKLKKVEPVEKIVETANTNSPMVVNALQKVLSSRYNALANSSSSEFDATDVSTDNEWYQELDEEQIKKQNKAKLYENLLENVVTDARDKKKLKKLYSVKNAKINNNLISKYGVKNNPILIDNTYIDLLNESNYVRLIQDLMLKNETALSKQKIDEAVALKPDSPLLLDIQKKIDDILTD